MHPSLFINADSLVQSRSRSSSVIPFTAARGSVRWTFVFTLFTFWPPLPPLLEKVI